MPEIRNARLAHYLQNNSVDKTRLKGIKIFTGGRYTMTKIDLQGKGEVELKVLSDESWDNKFYLTKVSGFASENSLVLSSCNCPYDYSGICKHRIAAIFALDKYLQNAPISREKLSMLDTEVSLNSLADEELKQNTMPAIWENRGVIKNVKILSVQNNEANFLVNHKNHDYKLHFSKIHQGKIYTSCSCNQEYFYPLCEHKIAALLVLREQFGKRAFDVMKDWTVEKNKLLAEYGYHLTDDISKLFDFKITDDAKLQLIQLDPAIHKLSQFQDWHSFNEKLYFKPKQSLITKSPEDEKYEQVLFYAFNKLDEDEIPDIQIEALTARQNLINGKITHINSLTSQFSKTIPAISALDSKLINQIQRLEQGELIDFIKEKGLSKNWFVELNRSFFSDDAIKILQEYIGEKYDKLLPNLVERRVFLSYDGSRSINSMQELKVSSQKVKPSFTLREDDEFVILEASLNIGGEKIKLDTIENVSFWFIKNQEFLHKITSANDANLLQYFKDKQQIKVKKQNFSNFLSEFVLPLTENADVNFNVHNEFQTKDLKFKESRIFLKEDEENLLIVPMYVYEDFENPNDEMSFGEDGRSCKIDYQNDIIQIYQRDTEQEFQTYSFIEALHSDFAFQGNYPFFYLPFGDVMKNNWLFDFFDKIQEAQIPVFGFKELKKLKYNPNRPKMQIRNGSGIDWFDMKLEISFGDQFVSLNDLKKAIVKKQNYVELKDGTLGMLPEEWLNRYAQLFKMGSIKGDIIKISKLHFNIIDELSAEINDLELAQELHEKKQKLLNFKEIQAIPLPENINATLRDYQVEGFKWLNFLEEFGWGGCLADDMGLGKTLQMLTFLQEQQNRNPTGVNLVVLPTTLIFNWQAEAEKFCPELKIFVHKGAIRNKEIGFFKDYDLVLTTYGMVRSDIEILRLFEFNYIILDESQAIKNPDSLTSKAVRLLRSKNRVVMTGTPVENNTFDLYSQMEFLNPGFLGSQEFFKTEFAIPIDKLQDKFVAQKLRTMVKPFMLKRTKEEVAKDLPEKTETILYCEMGKKQRKVYDTFRETYRQRIVDKMATEGKDKSAFLILEGLLKLRQICDSPVLLSDDIEYGNESAKLEEILREIEENASNHKIVIFSQFLKMLDLIRQHLEQHHIPYEYLDGQTTDRAARVNRFQANENCRVFLMSLKAGGVGINLTEADYVYLVDPWWNPAVEQQAIDRTHRIGQKKNVFAYRMICKDSIEEKILQLQAKKKDIANDIISTEAGFIKKLTREDVVELFS